MFEEKEKVNAMNDELQAKVKEPFIIPRGDYIAEVVEVLLVDNPFATVGEDPKQVRLICALSTLQGQPLIGKDGEPTTAWYHMGLLLGFKRDGTPYKPLAWSQAFLGRKIDPVA
jgi:hypothetical protein